RVCTDLFELDGRHYLIMIDSYSGFPFAKRLSGLTTKSIVKALNAWFMDWGNPKFIRSDGGPQFRTEFETYCISNDITHETSSPYHSRSNGMAESGVKIVKRLLQKCDGNWDEFLIRLREMRNIRRSDGNCPAEMLIGRRQRCLLPALPIDDLKNTEPGAETEARRERRREEAPKRHTRPKLRPLASGETVAIQDVRSKKWNRTGTVISERKHGGSYWLETEGQWRLLRNRRFLKPLRKPIDDPNERIAYNPTTNVETPAIRKSPRRRKEE
ncbi:Transposon Tf2-6 poly, partial [Paramuricea clavata]